MKKEIFPILFLLLLITLFFYPVLFQNRTFITTGLIQSDLMNQNYPLKFAYGQKLKEGKLLLWSSLIGNGYPVFAEGQTGELYPPNLLLFKLLSPLRAYNYSLLGHYFLAGFFTYLFCRRILKLKKISALLSSVIFPLSGFFQTHLVHPAMIQTASYIPLNLLLLEKILVSKKRRKDYIIALAVVFTLQFLAGHHELLYFTIIFLFIYLALRTFQIYKKKFLLPFLSSAFCFFLSGLLALCLSAVQFLPTIELVKFSTRKFGLSFQEATAYLFPLSHLFTFIFPRKFKFSSTVNYSAKFPDAINLWETYGYVGILPLILAGVTIIVWILNIIKKPQKTKIGNWELGIGNCFI